MSRISRQQLMSTDGGISVCSGLLINLCQTQEKPDAIHSVLMVRVRHG